MAIEYVRDVIASGYNLSKINDNFAKIEEALQDGLSRSGEGPNAMASDIDLNSNDLLNAGIVDTAELRIGGAVITPDALATIPASVMLKDTYDPQGKEADVFDSVNTDFTNSGTGTVERSVRAKLRDLSSVKDFGAVGDNSTNDTVAITNAVANALLTGRSLYWPEGTYITTASIPNLHDVRHTGDGYIKRGTNLFGINPKPTETNTLYCAPNAGNTNDGLSSSEPLSPQRAANKLTNYGPVLEGTWVLSLADGTYSLDTDVYSTVVIPANLQSNKQIVIKATTDVGGMRVTPAVIINRGAASAFRTGVGGSGPIDVLVKDIKCVGFKAGANPNADGFHRGFGFGLMARVEAVNIHTDDCDIGLYVFNQVSYSAKGCKFSWTAGGGAGIQELFGCVRAIVNEDDGHCEVFGSGKANGGYGLRAKELCTGHGNGLRVYDVGVGIHMNRCSTMNASSSTIQRCRVGVWIRSSSFIWPNNIDFGLTTVNACDETIVNDATSGTVLHEEIPTGYIFTGRGEKMMWSYTPDPVYTLTGSTAETVVSTMSKVRAGQLARPGARLRGEVWGRKSGAAGAVTVFLRYGTSNTLSVIIPAAATIFKIEFNLFTKVKGKQTAFTIATCDTGNVPGRGDRTFDFDAASGEMSLRVQLANAADSVSIDGAWLWSTDALIEESLI